MALLSSSPERRRHASRRGLCAGVAGFLVSAVIFLAFTVPSTVQAQEPTPKEYQIKAVFLFNFVQFTTWPDSAFANPEAPIRIGVLGDDPFAGALAVAVQGEKVGQRPVIIEPFSRIPDLINCHVIFVCKSEQSRMSAIVTAFAGKPVLTVGDMPDFARRGGIINFYLEGQKVRFEINRASAQQSGFKLSSQLLGLARIVGPPRETGMR